MSFIDYDKGEIILKIVYYGPGLCGKTTNIQRIHSSLPPDARGKLIKVETRQERTIFFDFLPFSLPVVRDFKTRLNLYSVPGQLFYSASRRLVLKGVDGIVFVADSQRARKEANIIAMDDLRDNLMAYGYDVAKLPLVLQYNKRDVPSAMTLDELRADLNPSRHYPEFEAAASLPGSPGVFDTLKAVVKLMVAEFRRAR